MGLPSPNAGNKTGSNYAPCYAALSAYGNSLGSIGDPGNAVIGTEKAGNPGSTYDVNYPGTEEAGNAISSTAYGNAFPACPGTFDPGTGRSAARNAPIGDLFKLLISIILKLIQELRLGVML